MLWLALFWTRRRVLWQRVRTFRADPWVAFGPGGQNMKATSIITQLHGGKYMPVFPPSYAEQAATVPMTPWDKR